MKFMFYAPIGSIKYLSDLVSFGVTEGVIGRKLQ